MILSSVADEICCQLLVDRAGSGGSWLKKSGGPGVSTASLGGRAMFWGGCLREGELHREWRPREAPAFSEQRSALRGLMSTNQLASPAGLVWVGTGSFSVLEFD